MNNQVSVKFIYAKLSFLRLTDYFIENIDNGNMCGIILIDWKKLLIL